MAETIASAEATFGTVEAIGLSTVPVPGSVTAPSCGPRTPTVLRSADARHPRRSLPARDELAVTEDVADLLDVTIGDTVELGDARWTVVGRVENPADLGDRFALVTPSRIEQAERIRCSSARTRSRSTPSSAGSPAVWRSGIVARTRRPPQPW